MNLRLMAGRARSLGKIASLEADAVCKAKVSRWLVALNEMRASDSVNDEQARQLLFDLDQAYSAFTASLGRK
jgi:ESCRT-I complex subunit VPS28